MTRADALELVARLALGLPADIDGVRRLLERVAQRDDAELLRDVLTEQGARSVLEERRRW